MIFLTCFQTENFTLIVYDLWVLTFRNNRISSTWCCSNCHIQHIFHYRNCFHNSVSHFQYNVSKQKVSLAKLFIHKIMIIYVPLWLFILSLYLCHCRYLHLSMSLSVCLCLCLTPYVSSCLFCLWLYFSLSLSLSGTLNLFLSFALSHRIMKLSSPKLNYLIILGSYWLYINVFFLIFRNMHDDERSFEALCNVRKKIIIIIIITTVIIRD